MWVAPAHHSRQRAGATPPPLPPMNRGVSVEPFSLAQRTSSERVVDRSAHACFARAKHERYLGSARRLVLVPSGGEGQLPGEVSIPRKAPVRTSLDRVIVARSVPSGGRYLGRCWSLTRAVSRA